MISCTPHDFTCTLKGTVVDRKSDTLILKRRNEDLRFATIFIPIINGKFEYKMEVKDIVAWDFTFKDELDGGGWRPIKFFPDQKIVQFELYPQNQFEKNKIIGGKINQSMVEYYQAIQINVYSRVAPLLKIQDSLEKNNQYWTPELKRLSDSYESAKSQAQEDFFKKQMDSLINSGNHKTPLAREIEIQYKQIGSDEIKFRSDYISKNLTIQAYSMILEDLVETRYNSVTLKEIREIYPVFAKKFPNHPYTKLVGDILNGLENIKIGGHFIDFTLPDLNGSKHTLSELIKGKVAIIDLWATWCGPCIRHTRELAPIYDEYHDKGFTIVGIAAEIKNTDAMKDRLEKEKWPWVNLVDLDRQNQIWDKYGVSLSVGKIIMVDKNGTVLAVDPTGEEVKAKLKELL